MRPLYSIAVLGWLTLTLASGPAAAFDPRETSYEAPSLGLTVHAPQGWILHPQSGFPAVLVLMVSPDGRASISVARGQLEPGQSLDAFLRRGCGAMKLLGMTVSHCGPMTVVARPLHKVVALSRGRGRRVEQIYTARNGRVIIFSLNSPAQAGERFSELLFRVFEGKELRAEQNLPPSYNVIRGVPSGQSGEEPPLPDKAPQGPQLEERPLPDKAPQGPQLEEQPLPDKAPQGPQLEEQPLPEERSRPDAPPR